MRRMELDRDVERRPLLDRATATGRGRALTTTGAAILALFLGCVVWLFGSTPPRHEAPAGIGALPSIDGTLLVVESDRLVLDAFEPLGGDSEIEFMIREADQGNFDLAHLRSHSSIALPTRLFYEREDGEYFAVYKEDAPANSAREAG